MSKFIEIRSTDGRKIILNTRNVICITFDEKEKIYSIHNQNGSLIETKYDLHELLGLKSCINAK